MRPIRVGGHAQVTAAMVAAGRTLGEPRAVARRAHASPSSPSGGPRRPRRRARSTADPSSSSRPSRRRCGRGPTAAACSTGTPSGEALVYAAVDGGVWLQPAAGGAAPPARRPARRRRRGVAGRQRRRRAGRLRRRHPPRRRPRRSTAAWPQLRRPGRRLRPRPGVVARRRPWRGTSGTCPTCRGPAAASSSTGDGVVGRRRAAASPSASRGSAPTAASAGSTTRRAGPTSRPLAKEEHEHGRPAWGPGIRTWCWSPDGTEVAVCRNEDGFGRLVAAAERARARRRAGTTACRGVGDRSSPSAPAPARRRRSSPTTPAPASAARLAHGPSPAGPRRRRPARARRVGRTDDGVPVPPVLAAGSRPATAAAVLDPRRPDRPAPGRLQPPLRLVARPRLGRPRRRPPRLDRPRPGATSGPSHHRWGVVDVDDCAAAVAARRRRRPGRRRPGRRRSGASAGGFTALLLLAQHPELFAAGVALSAVTDLVDLAARSHRFERHSTLDLVGDHAAHVERSPLTHADAHHRAAAAAPRRRRPRRAGRRRRGRSPPASTASAAPSSCTCTRARATAGHAPPTSSTSSSAPRPSSPATSSKELF